MTIAGGLLQGLGGGLRDLYEALREADAQRRAEKERGYERDYRSNRDYMDDQRAARVETRQAEQDKRGEQRYQDEVAREQRRENIGLRQQDRAARERDTDRLRDDLRFGRFTASPGLLAALRDASTLRGKEFTGAGVSPEAANANAAMRQMETPDLAQLQQQARDAGEVGYSGYAPREARLGTAGGLTYHPDTVSRSEPRRDTTTTRGPTDTDRLAQGAMSRMLDAVQRMNALEDADPSAGHKPWGGTGRRLLAGAARGVFGEQNDLSEGLEYSGLSPAQQDHHALADEWTHQYIVFLPRFRSGRDMYHNVKHAYFPRVGVTDPEVIRSFRERREEAMRSILQAHNDGATPEQIEAMLVGDMTRHGVRLSNESGGPGGVPGAGASPAGTPVVPAPSSGPRINPRFMPRVGP